MKVQLVASSLVGILIVVAPPAQGASFTTYSDVASFSAAVAGPIQVQDFQGYPEGTNMSGVEFLPGISATTNMSSLIAFGSSDGTTLFGIDGRDLGNARYDIAVNLPYRSLAFEIHAFEASADPTTASGPGELVVFFSDASSTSFNIFGNPAGSPVFFGIVANTSITAVQWKEALEGTGTGNEETSLDNFRVGPPVPEPATCWMLGLGFIGLAWLRRRLRVGT